MPTKPKTVSEHPLPPRAPAVQRWLVVAVGLAALVLTITGLVRSGAPWDSLPLNRLQAAAAQKQFSTIWPPRDERAQAAWELSNMARVVAQRWLAKLNEPPPQLPRRTAGRSLSFLDRVYRSALRLEHTDHPDQTARDRAIAEDLAGLRAAPLDAFVRPFGEASVAALADIGVDPATAYAWSLERVQSNHYTALQVTHQRLRALEQRLRSDHATLADAVRDQRRRLLLAFAGAQATTDLNLLAVDLLLDEQVQAASATQSPANATLFRELAFERGQLRATLAQAPVSAYSYPREQLTQPEGLPGAGGPYDRVTRWLTLMPSLSTAVCAVGLAALLVIGWFVTKQRAWPTLSFVAVFSGWIGAIASWLLLFYGSTVWFEPDVLARVLTRGPSLHLTFVTLSVYGAAVGLACLALVGVGLLISRQHPTTVVWGCLLMWLVLAIGLNVAPRGAQNAIRDWSAARYTGLQDSAFASAPSTVQTEPPAALPETD